MFIEKRVCVCVLEGHFLLPLVMVIGNFDVCVKVCLFVRSVCVCACVCM